MPADVTLAHMVDLALGSPEVGAVNFNVLHSLLHAMLTKLDIREAKSEIREEDREMLSTGPSGQTLMKSLMSESAVSASSLKGSSGVTRSPYHGLEARLGKVESHLENLGSLPSNSDLFKTARSGTDAQEASTIVRDQPLKDMYQMLQLQKRVDANEIVMHKLMSLVEDLMKELQEMKNAQSAFEKKLSQLNMDELMEKLKNVEDNLNTLNDAFSQLPPVDEIVTWPALEDALNGMRKELQPQERVVIELSTQTDKVEMVSRPVSAASRPISRMSTASSGPSDGLAEVLEKLGGINKRHEELEERVEKLEDEMKNKADRSELDGLGQTGIPDDLLDQLKLLRDEIDKLKQSREKDSDALARVQQAIRNLQGEIEKLNDQTKHLMDENDAKQKQIENLFVITATLEEKKANKDYVDMEVDVKADKKDVNNKVNRSVFDSTCNELNKMIGDLLEKLAAYEDAWKKAHGQLTSDIDGKLDRLELDALKDYIDAKLKALNNKLNKAHDWIPQGDDDAAGLRKQLLQRFHCISCDRPVELMPQGAVPSMPSGTGLPATRSPRPYTTFELDQIRQHAKSLLNPDGTDYYATSRSCGGNHTTTLPHRRITRMSNLREVFVDDVGQIIPGAREAERDIQGQDGHIYKGRVDHKLPQLTSQQLPQSRAKTASQQRFVHPPNGPVPQRPTSARPLSRTSMNGTQRMQAERSPSPDMPNGYSPESVRPQSPVVVIDTEQPLENIAPPGDNEQSPDIPEANTPAASPIPDDNPEN